MISRIIFGLGSNLGDRDSNINSAVKKLVKDLELTALKQSRSFANPALLAPNSPKEWNLEFLNTAVSADVDLAKFPPLKILEIIKRIEVDLGRSRDSKLPWGEPRIIDIDILAIEDLVIRLENKLIIPHHDLPNRIFFLATLNEIEPDWKYPATGKNYGLTAAELIKKL